MVTSTEVLAQQIEALRDRVNKLARTPQLPNSAIDNGAITVVSSGQPTAYVGVQYDGTSGSVTVAGPTPPYPNPPTVTTTVGGVKVHWDGTFAAPQIGFTSPVVAPLDFAGVDVHVSNSPTFDDDNVGFGTQRGSIMSGAGGDHFVAWQVSGQQVYARLVTRTKPGKFSPPSQTTGPVPTGQVQLGDIGFPIAQYSGGSTIYFTVSPITPTPPAWGFTPGDLWLNQTATATGASGGPPLGTPLYLTSQWTGSGWVLLQDQGISQSLTSAIIAQTTADSKATVFTQTHVPSWSGVANSAYWINTAPGADGVTEVWNGTAFVPFQLGNGAIQPNSLIASNVVATGTVTAALLEAQMVLTNTLIAGDPNGNHSALQPDGLHLFAATNDGTSEVGRLTSGSSNFFGYVDGTGMLVANWDSTGYLSASGGNFKGDITVQGTPLSTSLANAGSIVSYFQGNAPANTGAGFSDYGPIQARVGVAEVNGFLTAGRDYAIEVQATGSCALDDRVEGRTYVLVSPPSSAGSDSAPAPTTTSTEVSHALVTFWWATRWQTFNFTNRFSCTTNGRHRFLFAIERGALGFSSNASANLFIVTAQPVILILRDLGPTKQPAGQITQAGGAFAGGGSPGPAPTPPQNFDWTGPASSSATFRGNDTLRTDTTDVVQGWDPSGFNGDGYGYVGFSVPTITGTITGMWVTVNWNWTYFNSGGTLLMTPIHSGTTTPYSNFAALQMASQWAVPVSGKSGQVTLSVPSSWWSFFLSTSSPQASFIGFGHSGGSNETYYVRVAPAACSLRITYSQ